MDLQPNANPVGTGSGVQDAAQSIESLGLLESEGEGPQGPTEKQANTPAEPGATPESEAEDGQTLSSDVANQEREPDAEDAQEPAEESAEADAEAESLELPDTLTGLAEALGLELNDLMALKTSSKVNGEIKEVTLSDAVKGHQLEADYRQKTAQVAGERRTFEAAVSQAQQEWRSRFERADALIQDLESLFEAEKPNLEAILANEGAEAYLAAKARHDAKMEALSKAKDSRDRDSQQRQSESDAAAERYYAEQQRQLVERIPAFADEGKAEKLQKDLRAYLHDKGFNEQEIGGVVDARFVDVIHDAMQFRTLKKSATDTKKTLKTLPKVIKPGKAQEPGEGKARKQTALVRQLSKTGDRGTAAKFIEGLL